jgi:hypothetical protein
MLLNSSYELIAVTVIFNACLEEWTMDEWWLKKEDLFCAASGFATHFIPIPQPNQSAGGMHVRRIQLSSVSLWHGPL